MGQLNIYRLAISREYAVFVCGALIVLSCGLVLLLVMVVQSGDTFHLPFTVFVCAAMAWNWYVILRIPYEIRFHEPDRVSFVALAKTTTVSVEELQSIKPTRNGAPFYVLRHDGGRIRLLSQMTGFHELITRIKAANPRFEAVGI